MDCYSAESEFIESLDFLSPPVKRVHSREAFGSPYHNEENDVHLLRGLRNKFARRAPSSTRDTRTVKTHAESSTSLILQKTSERQILEHYSIVSYTSLQRPEHDTPSQRKSDRRPGCVKPLIKVTVIPKTDQVQTAKILRKRRYIPKTVQSTASNHENSVQTKNVYLIVAGRRKEKIYEIKTTGSATFSTDHDNSNTKDDEIPVKQLSNFRHLIQSLNMDRKKKKDKKAPLPDPDGPKEGSFPNCINCFCNDLQNEDNDTPKKSRVRIFGQFGISDQDKYVLRYGATIDDKQVLSEVAQLTRDFSPIIFPVASHYSTSDENPVPQKDSAIQADNNNDAEAEDRLHVVEIAPSKESQGTQVNFNVQVATTKINGSRFSDKKIQCSCCAVVNKSDHKTLKDCQSPLVIISVYPKPSPGESTKSEPISGINNTEIPSPPTMQTYTSNQVLIDKDKKQFLIDKGTRKSNMQPRRNYKSPAVSRSPSPMKGASRSKIQEDKSIKLQVSEKKSPDRQKALRAIKDKIQEKDRLKEARKSSKYNSSNATQVSKNLQNLTVSNATQVSQKKNQFYTTSNATQVSTRDHQNYTVSNATQYNNPLNLKTSNGTQWVDSPQTVAPVKHSKNSVGPIQYPHNNNTNTMLRPQTAYVSNATQVPRIPQQVFVSNATQANTSKNENVPVSNGTQVSRNKPNFIATRFSKNQETVTSFHASPVVKNEQKLKPVSKLITERGTNTDHARAKKALVDTYTKKLTEQMCQKDYIPTKFNNSKVTINIDGDREYYDVLFNQDKLSTDLTIRKKLKDTGSQKYYDEEFSASFDNMGYLPECAVEKDASPLTGNKSPVKSLSVAVYNNRSDDESPLTKHVSRLTIRDSIEISHRREDKCVHNNIKNTQTCFTAQFADKIPDESEFLAPIKHYTGDDCSISNPIERDKQIRELLGVDNGRFTYAKSKQARNSCENDDRFPYQYIYRQECKKSQVTEINFQLKKLLPCLKSKNDTSVKSLRHASVSVQCRNPNCPKCQCNNYDYHEEQKGTENNDNKNKFASGGKCFVNPVNFARGEGNRNYDMEGNRNYDADGNRNYAVVKDNNYIREENPSIYQQLILNRNVQVFLQVDQFSKQKPIVLSQKQYNKVKKTIQKTICTKKSSHDKRKKIVCNKFEKGSEVSVGEVRAKKANDPKLLQEREAQTEIFICSRESCRSDKKKHLWKSKTRKPKLIIKHDSSDQSGEDCVDSPDQEKSRKTGRLDKNRKKQPSAEIHLPVKPKRKVDRGVEVCTIDQSCANSTSWRSDRSEQNRNRYDEVKPERVPERSYAKRDAEIYTEQVVGSSSEQIGENEERTSQYYSKQKRSHSPERYIDRKGNRSLDKYSEVKERHRPEKCNELRETRSPERYIDRKGNRSADKYNEIKERHSPEKCNELRETRSPERYIDRKGNRSSDKNNEIKETHSPEKCNELRETRRPKRYIEIKECHSPDRYSFQNEEKHLQQYHHVDGRAIQQPEPEIKTLVLYNAENKKETSKDARDIEIGDARTRKTMSSVEIRFASVAFMKQAAYSSTDVGALSDSSIAHVNSFHTIFRGHRKSPTPNLGTSVYSLYSEELNSDHKSAKYIMEPRDSKPKKPFLRRLMSCLVMRSTRDSELKLPTGPLPDVPSVNSSIDSYHISTSLGAVEVSSSIYDTSASFYSNHTILPVNSKIKRGFFSSVRGFLTNRKS